VGSVIPEIMGFGARASRLRDFSPRQCPSGLDSPGGERETATPSEASEGGSDQEGNLPNNPGETCSDTGNVLSEVFSSSEIDSREVSGLYRRSTVECSNSSGALQGRGNRPTRRGNQPRRLGRHFRLGRMVQPRNSNQPIQTAVTDDSRRSNHPIQLSDVRVARSPVLASVAHQTSIRSPPVSRSPIRRPSRRLGLVGRLLPRVHGLRPAGNLSILHAGLHPQLQDRFDTTATVHSSGRLFQHTGALRLLDQSQSTSHSHEVQHHSSPSGPTQGSPHQAISQSSGSASPGSPFAVPSPSAIFGDQTASSGDEREQGMGMSRGGSAPFDLGAGVVATECVGGERHGDPKSSSVNDNSQGCFPVGMGSSRDGNGANDVWLLEQHDSGFPLNGNRSQSGHSGCQGPDSQQRPPQHANLHQIGCDDIGLLHQSTRGVQALPQQLGGGFPVVVLEGETNHLLSSTHCGSGQHDRGLSQPHDQCLDGAGTGPMGIQPDMSEVGESHPRPLRIVSQQQGSPLCQLETRPRGVGSGCSDTQLAVGDQRICVPSGPDCGAHTARSDSEPSPGINSGHPVLDSSTLVPSGDETISGPADATTSTCDQSATGTGIPGPSTPTLELDRLAYMWQRAASKGIQPAGFELLLNAWKSGSGSHHDLHFRRWVGYRSGLGLPHEDPSSVDLLNYCAVVLSGTRKDELGPASYSNVKALLGAIKVTYSVASASQYVLDEDILMQRLRKASAIQAPAKPKPNFSWSLQQFMSFIHVRFANPTLVSDLRAKVILLLRADLFLRSSDFCCMFREHITRGQSHDNRPMIAFSLYRPKEWAEGKSDWTSPVWIHSPHSRHSSLDSVSAIEAYLDATNDCAKEAQITVAGAILTPFLISSNRQSKNGVKCYTRLEASTISSITRRLLSDAGICVDDDGPHSTRGVSASHVYAITESEQEVVSRGRWASATTFLNYYSKGFTTGVPVSLYPDLDKRNIADVLRCTFSLQSVHAMQVDGDSAVEQPDDSMSVSDPDSESEPIHISVGQDVRFAKGFWQDFPRCALKARVTKISSAWWHLFCYKDKSTLEVPVSQAAALIKSGDLVIL
jgi:hypothetical protein